MNSPNDSRHRLARPVCTFPLLLAVLLAPAAAPALADATADHTEAKDLADAYVTAFRERAQLEASNSRLQEDIKWLEAGGGTGPLGRTLAQELGGLDGESQKVLASLLEGAAQPLLSGIEAVGQQAAKQAGQLEGDWKDVRADLCEGRTLLFKAKASRQLAGQLAYLFSMDNKRFWLFGLIAVAALVAVVWHERRHEVRRWLSGGRARALGLSAILTGLLVGLFVLTVVIFVFGDSIYNSLLLVSSGEQAPRVELLQETETLQKQVQDLKGRRQTLESDHERSSRAWRERLEKWVPPNFRLADQWEASRAGIRRAAEHVALQTALATAIRSDIQQLDNLKQDLTAHHEATASYERMKDGIRGGLGFVLLGLAGTGGFFFWRNLRQREERAAETCLLCLKEGTLGPVRGSGAVSADRDSEEWMCGLATGSHRDEGCGFAFKAVYRDMQKLCFPTLGIPQSGKTFWLAMLYRLLNQSCPEGVQFETVKSSKSEDFDGIVNDIIQNRIDPAATQTSGIPHPLIFNFADHDWAGRSNVLLSIFDYSGEITTSRQIDDTHRRRALDGDGFLFFLDPTFPSEPQANALARFREDLRVVKKLKAGQQIRAPIALCVSKLDLMVNEKYAASGGRNDIEEFYDRLREIDPTGSSWDVGVMEARSRLIADLRDTIWPGWQIEKQIDRLFGGRFLFFPMTPVGLNELGETSLRGRVLQPFAILEPLLWLLQMNGYKVLG